MSITSGFSSPKRFSRKVEFLISDWVLESGSYYVDLQHNLESEDVFTNVSDLQEMVDVDRITVRNTNTVRLYVTYNPDCRFDGKAIITKSQ